MHLKLLQDLFCIASWRFFFKMAKQYVCVFILFSGCQISDFLIFIFWK
jgi:hypothetical protein